MNIDYAKVPADHMIEGVKRWIEDGKIGSGSFLWAIVTNDLLLATGKADTTNKDLLREWALFFYWETPSNCHGSVKVANEWIKMHELARKQEETRT